MLVTLKNDAGLTRQVKVGFSWTSFFFGSFPFFFRGMAGSGLIWLVVGFITLGLSSIYLWFTINKKTAHHFMDIGYKPAGEGWNVASIKWGVSLPPYGQSQVDVQQAPPMVRDESDVQKTESQLS